MFERNFSLLKCKNQSLCIMSISFLPICLSKSQLCWSSISNFISLFLYEKKHGTAEPHLSHRQMEHTIVVFLRRRRWIRKPLYIWIAPNFSHWFPSKLWNKSENVGDKNIFEMCSKCDWEGKTVWIASKEWKHRYFTEKLPEEEKKWFVFHAHKG